MRKSVAAFYLVQPNSPPPPSQTLTRTRFSHFLALRRPNALAFIVVLPPKPSTCMCPSCFAPSRAPSLYLHPRLVSDGRTCVLSHMYTYLKYGKVLQRSMRLASLSRKLIWHYLLLSWRLRSLLKASFFAPSHWRSSKKTRCFRQVDQKARQKLSQTAYCKTARNSKIWPRASSPCGNLSSFFSQEDVD